MYEKSPTDSFSRPAATPNRDPSSGAPWPADFNPLGDSETIRRYRQFFQTHDLHGSPQRGAQSNR